MNLRIPVQINGIDLAIATIEKALKTELPEEASQAYKNGFYDCARVLKMTLEKVKAPDEKERETMDNLKTAVLISIRPKWCELIANREKTIEVRKTKPKLQPPFKCYIYCTQSKEGLPDSAEMYIHRSGKVIGEFICDSIIPISVSYSNPNHHLSNREFPFTGLTDKAIMEYLGNGVTGYGWHISELVIYDEPKELTDFGLSRPPQSWCYVEVEK